MSPHPPNLRSVLRTAAAATIVAATAAGSIQAQQVEELSERLRDAYAGSGLNDASWAALIVSLDSGDTLFSVEPDVALAPASNLKLLTTAAALRVLGARLPLSDVPGQRRRDLGWRPPRGSHPLWDGRPGHRGPLLPRERRGLPTPDRSARRGRDPLDRRGPRWRRVVLHGSPSTGGLGPARPERPLRRRGERALVQRECALLPCRTGSGRRASERHQRARVLGGWS